jgi:putative transcriptional regulator
MIDNNSLVGQFLIASPSLKDPNFEKTVTLICEQSESGSLGLIINKPLHHDLDEVITEMNLNQLDSTKISFLQGGPVGLDRGFVIHNSGFWKNTTEINENTFITSSRDIIDDMVEGKGPSNSIFIVGYSGWGAGQLETELMTNSWLSAPYDPAIVFDVDTESRWEKSIDSLGIKSMNISDQIGHA